MGPYSCQPKPGSLSGTRRWVVVRRPMHHPVQAWVGRVDARAGSPPGVRMRLCVSAIQASTGFERIRITGSQMTHRNWLLCQLVDSSARVPTKDVPSCDKPEGAARRLRTQDVRMGIPLAIASRNGERRELKHLSTGRKRNRNETSSVTASERDTAQTEALTGNVVCGLTLIVRPSS